MANALHEKATRNVKFAVEGEEDLDGYLAEAGRDSPLGVVMIQEWWGMNLSIQKAAERFAVGGFKVLVPDLYRGKVAIDHEEAGHLMNGLNWDQAVADSNFSFFCLVSFVFFSFSFLFSV